jgi:hypothetical protein
MRLKQEAEPDSAECHVSQTVPDEGVTPQDQEHSQGGAAQGDENPRQERTLDETILEGRY